MAALDYGVIALENGNLKENDAEKEFVWQGAMGHFLLPTALLYFERTRTSQAPNEQTGNPGLYIDFREAITGARKKVLQWNFDSPKGLIQVKTKDLGNAMYLSTFFFGGNRYAILQGYDIDLKNHWNEESRVQVKKFLSRYAKS